MKSKKTPLKKQNTALSRAASLEAEMMRADFKREVQGFLETSGLPRKSTLALHPERPDAAPVYFLTGASFTLFEPDKHGDSPTHSFCDAPEGKTRYLANNTAALLERLMNDGKRVVVHSGKPDLIREIVRHHKNADKIIVIGGDLSNPAILQDIYRAFETLSAARPISTIKMALYQSFAQNNDLPFKPIHMEAVEEVERAASKRVRFVFNMAALSYDLMINRGLEDLRIASLSALAANRASYGLMADAADKFMNELAWHTFFLEANASIGKSVSIYQINPGITTACDVYKRDAVKKIVRRESIADGFPLDDAVLENKATLPQMSAGDVAWVVEKLLDTPYRQNPNKNMPERIQKLLYGGFEADELKKRFEKAIKKSKKGISVDSNRLLPDHIIRSGTDYGALPRPKKGDYKRISLTPPGQRF